MLCYHKEYFALGIVGALFIVAVIHIFEDVIWGWFERVKEKYKIVEFLGNLSY